LGSAEKRGARTKGEKKELVRRKKTLSPPKKKEGQGRRREEASQRGKKKNRSERSRLLGNNQGNALNLSLGNVCFGTKRGESPTCSTQSKETVSEIKKGARLRLSQKSGKIKKGRGSHLVHENPGPAATVAKFRRRARKGGGEDTERGGGGDSMARQCLKKGTASRESPHIFVRGPNTGFLAERVKKKKRGVEKREKEGGGVPSADMGKEGVGP